MKYTIKDVKYIKTSDDIATVFAMDYCNDKMLKKYLKGITNIKNITTDTEFKVIDIISIYADTTIDYLVLENNLGIFVVREDNVNEIMEDIDILDKYDIKKIITANEKTILLTSDGKKYMTTLHKDDEYDYEKAVMILMLKRFGINVLDLYKIIDITRK